MRIDVVSIFPEYLAPLDLSLVGKARTSGLLDLRVHDLRDWTTDRHRTVDDTPFGGGAGMVMRPDVWGTALDELLDDGRAPAGADAVGGAVHAAHGRGAGRREPPGARVRSVRGDRRPRRRALPLAGARHRVLAGRLRAQRRRGGRARRRRGGRAPAARGRRQPGVAGRGVARGRRAAGVPRLHQAARVGRAGGARRCCCPGTTRGSPGGGGTPRSSGRPRVGRISSRRCPSTSWTSTTSRSWRRSVGSRSTDASRECEIERPIYSGCGRCGRLARWCAQVASLPQGRRLTTTRGSSTRTHRTIRPRTPVQPCTGRPRRPRRRS